MTNYYGASQVEAIDQRQQGAASMKLKRAPRNPEHRPEAEHDATHLALLDTLMDSYVRWRDESRTVHESYRQWQTAGREERSDAFDRYVTALDREEHAAHGYRHVLEQTKA
jgi:hypothetical protein